MFLAPEVSGIMKQNLVEARLHVDTQNTLTAEQFATNQKLRDDIAGTLAMPYFVVVDPKTGETVAEHSLSGGAGVWQEGWLDFLRFVLEESGRDGK
ncbi:MAG: hypothetical protein KDE27_15000 [Planctomycetes bacterium]|nr:hypothetical protein [Planctomycetota bacterium]